jgi:hypothetical protein
MRNNATLLNSLFPARDTFKYGKSLAEPLIRFHIHEIGCRASIRM